MSRQIIFSAALAFCVTAVLTFTLRPIAVRVHLTDKPGGRKRHAGEIPLVGGIAMLLGMLATMVILETAGYWFVVLPSVLLVIVGVLDDRYNTAVSARLLAQVGAVLIMMLGGGLFLRDIGDPFGTGVLGLGVWAVPLSVLFALTVINAFNFIDGIDGLAASMALVALAAGAFAAEVSVPAVAMAAIACGAILGFLPFNFPAWRNRHLRTFMGDAGSTLLGFIVVWFAVSVSQGEHRSLSPVTGLWFVLMPLSDLFSCVVRRAAKGKLPLHPGREHFHFMLMRAGLTGRQALGVLFVLAVVYAAVGLVADRLALPDWMLFAPWIALLGLQTQLIQRLAVQLRLRRLRSAQQGAALAGA